MTQFFSLFLSTSPRRLRDAAISALAEPRARANAAPPTTARLHRVQQTQTREGENTRDVHRGRERAHDRGPQRKPDARTEAESRAARRGRRSTRAGGAEDHGVRPEPHSQPVPPMGCVRHPNPFVRAPRLGAPHPPASIPSGRSHISRQQSRSSRRTTPHLTIAPGRPRSPLDDRRRQ